MYVIKKLILQNLKEIKKLQDLLLKKDKVLHNFLIMVGLILSDNFIQKKLNIHGGV